jgi:polyvinyl alcohol dehydrogenase (cytochrome)
MKTIRLLASSAALLLAVQATAAEQAADNPDGVDIFADQCAVCHAMPSDEKIPTMARLMQFDANTIVAALTDGKMRLQGQKLSAAQKTAVAEFLSGGKVREQIATVANICKANPPISDPAKQPSWTGWGLNVTNTRYQKNTGGITAANVPELKLKWAFGIANTMTFRAQPAIFAGRLFFGSATGTVYSINADTGCTYWTYQAEAGVRSAISVGPMKQGGASGYAIYFSDAKANAYALDAATGKKLWSTKVDTHPAATGTGSVTLYDGTLYVPMTGVSEESTSVRPDYECCTFRGSVTALDAATGKVKWKYYTVPKPEPRGKSSTGKQLWGPSGIGVWNAPTVDVTRGALYFGTGNSYSAPEVDTSSAVIALDLKTGALKWSKQLLKGDIWIFGCDASTSSDPRAGENPNCPQDVGPDYDIAASPVLTTTHEGKDLLIITQKSGMGYALDPDAKGRIVWQYHWGPGSAKGGAWGTASDGKQAYFDVPGQDTDAPGGVHAVDLTTGKRAWFAPPQPTLCERGPGCSPVQNTAITAIPGVVFVGSQDGGMRAYAADTGKIIWTYDTNKPFDTVNGVKANGASIDGPGPVVAGGTLYVNSGDAGPFSRGGNVLLAFTVGGK